MKKVVKFGGSSLASAEQFKKAMQIILSDDSRKYVVVSAPGKRDDADKKVTDMLYTCAAKAEKKEEIGAVLAEIKARFDEIIKGLDLNLSLEKEFNKIKADIENGAGSDYAASRGEYLNGILMAAALDAQFLDAADVMFFHDGGLELKLSVSEIERELRKYKNKVVVIPGFYGTQMNEEKRIKTFSRGGSDITGSIVSRAVNADVYENWTDVSGFLVADPHIIADAAIIESLTYRELRELAYMGAGVLHEDAIFPVRSAGIPINIKNTNMPDDPGTWIMPATAQSSKYTITGIAGKKGFAAVNIEKSLMNAEVGFVRKVLSVFEHEGISFEHLPSGIDTMSLFVAQETLKGKEQRIMASIRAAVNPDLIDIEPDLALIAIVGRAMKSKRGTAGRVFAALADARVNIKMIDQGSSELNIIIAVENEEFEIAIQAVYEEFVR